MADQERSDREPSSGPPGGSHGAGGGSPRSAAPGARGAKLEALIPERYGVREAEEGWFLYCDEAPRLHVSIDRGHSFSEAEARELGGRVIMLDGAGRFGPLLDNKAKLYNLDHHEGCLRAFTIASCEQALILVHSGLGLAEGDWTIYANEPDLDTVLAIWCLLNYVRLSRLSEESRDILLPLVRLEGAIDANGTELAEVCGLPTQTLQEAKRRLDRLHANEQWMKKRGEWLEADLFQYTLEMLREIDQLVFTSADFSDYTRVEVFGHAEIGKHRVAVACRDRSGIYQVERNLKERWGDQLGIVALEKEERHYTLRRPMPLADIDLTRAYEKLNLVDPAVDGRPAGKRWGGSDSIGGSPRPTGTALAPREILKVLQSAYQKPNALRSLGRLLVAALASAVILAGGWLVTVLGGRTFPELPSEVTPDTVRLATFALAVGLGSLIAARSLSGRRLWLFGLRRRAGGDWLLLAPLALVGAIPARAWVPGDLVFELRSLAYVGGVIALTAVALEFWFRGLVHGVVMLDSGAQSVGGRWFLSRAAFVSALLYSLVTVVASGAWIGATPPGPLDPSQKLGLVAAGSLITGVSLGMIRERSLSLWPGVFLQMLGGVFCAAFWFWLGG